MLKDENNGDSVAWYSYMKVCRHRTQVHINLKAKFK